MCCWHQIQNKLIYSFQHEKSFLCYLINIGERGAFKTFQFFFTIYTAAHFFGNRVVHVQITWDTKKACATFQTHSCLERLQHKAWSKNEENQQTHKNCFLPLDLYCDEECNLLYLYGANLPFQKTKYRTAILA